LDACSGNCQERNGCNDLFHNLPFVFDVVFHLRTV
jgi:hypothetical protein